MVQGLTIMDGNRNPRRASAENKNTAPAGHRAARISGEGVLPRQFSPTHNVAERSSRQEAGLVIRSSLLRLAIE